MFNIMNIITIPSPVYTLHISIDIYILQQKRTKNKNMAIQMLRLSRFSPMDSRISPKIPILSPTTSNISNKKNNESKSMSTPNTTSRNAIKTDPIGRMQRKRPKTSEEVAAPRLFFPFKTPVRFNSLVVDYQYKTIDILFFIMASIATNVLNDLTRASP